MPKFQFSWGGGSLWSEIPERILENLDTNLLFEVNVQKPAWASQIVSHVETKKSTLTANWHYGIRHIAENVSIIAIPRQSGGKVMFQSLSVCLSVCAQVGSLYGTSPHPPPVQDPSPSRPPNMFIVVRYVARIVGRRAVGIRLKCLLVHWRYS